MAESLVKRHTQSDKTTFPHIARLFFALVFILVTFVSVSSRALAQELDEYVEPKPPLVAMPAAPVVAAEPAGSHTTPKSILADLDVNTPVNLDLTIFKNLTAGFGYTYELHPSFQDDMFTRIDRWRPRLALEFPGILTRIEPRAEVVFIRQFPSQWEAAKALPVFDPKKIPLTSVRALGLQPGEVVILPIELNLLVGKGASMTAMPLALSFDAHYLMKGRFQAQILRMAGQHVRLRLVGIRSHGLEGEAGARLSLDVFNVSLADSAFEGFLGKKIASIGFSRSARAVVMADYVFDLADPAARRAYDRVLAADMKLSKLKVMNPAGGARDLQNAAISDLTEVDRIAKEDAAKPIEARRINAIFKGRSEGNVKTEKRELNLLRLYSMKRTSSVSNDNHIVFMDSDNQELDFFAPSSTLSTQRRFLFGLGSENMTRKASVIVPADEQGKPKGMGEYVVSIEMKDKRMSKGETAKALRYFRRSIARPIVEQLGIDELLTRTSYRHARVYVQAIFNHQAMAAFEAIDPASLRPRLTQYLASVRDQLPGDDEHDHADWIHDRRKDIDSMLSRLTTALSPLTPSKERIRIFIDLQKNKFFREAGTGFLMSLLPEAELERDVAVTMRVDAVGFTQPIEKAFGASDFESVAKVTEYIQHMLEEGTFDLRLETFGTDLSAGGQIVSFNELRRLAAQKTPSLRRAK